MLRNPLSKSASADRSESSGKSPRDMGNKPRTRRTGTVVPGELGAEIQQSRPFRSEAQEATIALLRTASVVARRLAKAVEPSGISLAQYNVLRILRGAGTAGLPTLGIKDRMIEEGTTVTRLLDKLEDAGLVHRKRSRPDRRQVLCTLTAAGARLLSDLDPAVDVADDAAVAMLHRATRRQLIAVLSTIRRGTPGGSD